MALYLFTRDAKTEKGLISLARSCVNDTIIHLATPRIWVSGVGGSGMEVITERKF